MPPSSFSEAVSKRKRQSSSDGGSPEDALFGAAASAPRDPYIEMVQTIARLRVAGGDSAKTADEMLGKYGREIPPALLAQYGIPAPKGGGGSGFFDKAKRVGGGALMGGLELLSRPGQASLELLQAGGQALDANTGIDFFGDAEQGGGSIKDVGKALLGKQDHSINLREAVGLDPNAGGRLAGFFDTAGSIVLDPTTYITGGTAPAATQGLKIVGKEFGEGAAKQIAKQGFKQAVEPGARAVFREALTSAGATPQVLQGLERGGAGGLKFAGKTVLSGESIRGARAGLGISDNVAANTRRVVGTPARLVGAAIEKPLTSVRSAFQNRSGVAALHGREAAEQLADAGSASSGFTSTMSEDAVLRLTNAGKAANATPAENAMLRDALETPGQVPILAANLRSEGKGDLANLLEVMESTTDDFTGSLVDSGLALPNSVLAGVRKDALDEALHVTRSAAVRPLTPATKLAERASRRAAAASDLAREVKQGIGESLEGAGRDLTAAEGKRVGALSERARVAEASATKLETKLGKLTDNETALRTQAFDRAVDDAIKGLPKAQRGADAAAARAARASDNLSEYVDQLLQVDKPTAAQLRKLGKLEGRKALFEKEAARLGRGLDRSVSKAGVKVGDAGTTAGAQVARQEARLSRQATIARDRADEALEHAQEIRDDIVRKASLADAKAPSAGQAKRLGVVEERARSAENLAKLAERRLAKTIEKVNKDLSTRAVTIAEKKADAAVSRFARNNPVLKEQGSYVFRFTDPESLKILREAGGDFREIADAAEAAHKSSPISAALGQGGATKNRVLFPDKLTTEANATLADNLGKPGFKLFIEDPLISTAKRAVSAYRAVAEVKYLNDVAAIKGSHGKGLILIGDDVEAEALKLGYKSISSKYMKNVWADPEVAKELSRVQKVVFNDEAIESWTKFVDEWGSLWAAYATTPVIFGTGFFARNAMGNVFNNTLAGGINASHYNRGLEAQRAIAKVSKATGRSAGPEFEAALRKALPRDFDNVMEARSHGVINTGFSRGDLADDVLSKVEGTGRKGRFNPINRENILLKPGQNLNKAIEDNARLAHFFGKMDQLGDPVTASRSVKKYLFDYSDLTPFERNVLRRGVRFYTYMRKNTPLMFAEMAHQPGKFTAFAHINEGISGQGEDTGTGVLPQYAINRGAVQFKGKLFSIDTPFSAAMQTVEPAVQAIGLIPGVRALVPEQMRPEGGFRDVASGAIALPSGGPIEVLKFLTEETVGKSLFTGAPLQAGADARAKRFVASINPLFSKGLGTGIDREGGAPGILKGGVIDQALNLSGRDKERVKLLTSLIGVSTVYNDPQAQRGEKLRQLALVQDALDELRSMGVDVPTIKELREDGIIPEPDAKPRSISGKKHW